jgi:hypothetical protein
MMFDRRTCLPSLLAALGLLSSACAANSPERQTSTTATPPMEILRLSSPGGAFTPVPLQTRPIQPAAAVAPPARAAAGPGFTHLHGGLDAASRGGASVSPGNWALAGSATLQPEFETFGLLAASDRVLVLGRVHELFDGAGRSLFWALTGASLPGLFPETNAILGVEPNGGLLRRSLATGEVEFKSLVFGGDEYLYGFVGMRGNSYVVAGSERALDPHGAHKPRWSGAQRLRIEAPFKVDPSSRLLLSAKGGEQLRLAALGMMAVASADRVVFIVPGLVLGTDFDLVPGAAFTADFAPIAASISADGDLHLLVRATRGIRYWRIDAEGRRTREVIMTDDISDRPVPPILGYDGRVYLQSKRMLTVVEADGSHRSSVILRSPHARAAAQPDGTLLVADEGTIWHLDASLRAVALANVPAEEFRTPAVAVSSERFFVASASRLLRFERRSER